MSCASSSSPPNHVVATDGRPLPLLQPSLTLFGMTSTPGVDYRRLTLAERLQLMGRALLHRFPYAV